MSSACVLISKTHSFRFLHCSESHYRCFESTLMYGSSIFVRTPTEAFIGFNFEALPTFAVTYFLIRFQYLSLQFLSNLLPRVYEII